MVYQVIYIFKKFMRNGKSRQVKSFRYFVLREKNNFFLITDFEIFY